MQALEPGDPRRIGRFTLEGRLGAGGMGRVYFGRSASGRRVAVKCVHRHLLDDDPTFRDRFRREVAAARAVGGFWTPAIVDSDADAEQPWYASAYVEAPTLHDVVRRQGLLGLPAAAALGAGLAEALAAIHAADLVHRDLKPSNVLMADDGPRVIDFGIVRAAQDGTALTGTGVRLLSLGYSPPEQMRGQPVKAASDVFSLGVVLVFATAGHLPYPGATEVAVDRRMDDPPDLDGVPGPLRGVLRRCLAVDPTARPTVPDLLAAFNRLVELDTQPVTPARPVAPPRPTRVDVGPSRVRPPDPPPPEPSARPTPAGARPPTAAPAAAPEPTPGPSRGATAARWAAFVAAVLLAAAVVAVLTTAIGLGWLVTALVGLLTWWLILLAFGGALARARTTRDDAFLAAFLGACGLSIVCGVTGGVLASHRTQWPVWADWLTGAVTAVAVAAVAVGVLMVVTITVDFVDSDLPTVEAVVTTTTMMVAILLAAGLLWGVGTSVATAAVAGAVAWFVAGALTGRILRSCLTIGN